MIFTVDSLSDCNQQGHLRLKQLRIPCALGRSGRSVFKREGDGVSPIGCWKAREAFYRSDRIQRPSTRLPLRVIKPDYGWCDAPGDRNYNRFVRHPYSASAEHLWRDDHLYDLIVVLGYNDLPRVQGRGSAIFVHIAQPGFAPTEGCIALELTQLIRVLKSIDTRSVFQL